MGWSDVQISIDIRFTMLKQGSEWTESVPGGQQRHEFQRLRTVWSEFDCTDVKIDPTRPDDRTSVLREIWTAYEAVEPQGTVCWNSHER